MCMPSRSETFMASVFFVLGFSIVFSLVGVLLQSVLANVASSVQLWLARIGGTVIIVFGFYLLDLLRIPFLEQEHKLRAKKFNSAYFTSFIFGAAFAVGWTPCVGAVLGSILTLAATQATSAFFLMLSYSLGLGIPFLLVGLFTAKAQHFIQKYSKFLQYAKYIFGFILVLLGILVFTNQLNRVANLEIAVNILQAINPQLSFGDTLNFGIAFLAGVVSFLSPCVLPLIPRFLAYLATVKGGEKTK